MMRRLSLPLKAVLFDLDGTLLDTAPDFVTALNRVLTEQNRPTLDNNSIGKFVTGGSAALIREAFQLEETEPKFEPLKQRLLYHYSQCLVDQTTLYPGLNDLLYSIEERDIPWGIVTNKPRLYAAPILIGLDLKPVTLVCPDDVTHTKPSPEPILFACNKIGCEPQTAIYVGDHSRDIASGRSAGTVTIAVSYGYIPDDDPVEGWGADHIVGDSRNLGALINEYLE